MSNTKDEIIIVDEKSIKDKIYIIRGQKVMIDSDLAKIYGYSTKSFNQQVQRNKEKFDSDFMFKLTDLEVENLSRSHFVTSMQTKGVKGGRVYNPYVFTEQGIYMLMTVLKWDLAIKQSKALIRLFKSMKDYIVDNNNFIDMRDFLKLSIQTVENTNSIKEIKEELTSIMDNFIIPEKYREFLILNGESVEADIAYNNIYSLAKNSIYIIDNYLSLKTLVLLKNINIDFIKIGGIIHDRYIIIDYNTYNEKIYHCGTSSKDAGKRINTIIEINDRDSYHIIINKLLNGIKLNI